MVNNIGGSSGSHSTYYSQANDASSNRSNSGSQRRTRSSNGQFGSLAVRQDTLSEFGSAASGGPLDYSDYAGNPYYNQSEYSQWAGSVRTPSTSSAGSFASADNRSFDNRSTASSISSIASSHLPLSSHSGSSSQKSRRSRSDVSVALSEAGSRHSSHVPLPTRFSDRGSIASSLNDSEHAAIAAAMEGGRFGRRGWAPGSTGSDVSSLHSISEKLSEAGSTISSLHTISDNPSKGGSSVSSLHTISDNPSKSGSSVSSLHTISDNLSEAGSRSSSAERAELVERLNRLRDIGGSIPADRPSVTWQPDTELSVSDITPSTAVTEAPPPSRRPPPRPSRLGNVSFADSSTFSAAPSYQSSVAPSRRGPSIYGKQPALKRLFNSLNSRP